MSTGKTRRKFINNPLIINKYRDESSNSLGHIDNPNIVRGNVSNSLRPRDVASSGIFSPTASSTKQPSNFAMPNNRSMWNNLNVASDKEIKVQNTKTESQDVLGAKRRSSSGERTQAKPQQIINRNAEILSDLAHVENIKSTNTEEKAIAQTFNFQEAPLPQDVIFAVSNKPESIQPAPQSPSSPYQVRT